MPEIVVQPQNPRDLQPSELETLAADLGIAFPDVNIRIASRETRRRAHELTLHEVIFVWIPTAVGYAEVLHTVVKWARKRHDTANSRPKSIIIYGADGEPLKSVVVRADAVEVEEKLPSDKRRLPQPRSSTDP
jgi:hypothetical protein